VKFSILTPTHNAIDWIALCVASVRDQNVDTEHLIQDGLSNDGTREWIEANCRHARSEKDSGMYDALNRALDRSTGEIVGHLNADEQYLPGTLTRVAALFRANPEVDAVCGDMLLFDSRFQPRAYRRSVLPPPKSAAIVPLQIPTCGLFVRRRVFESGLVYRNDLHVIADAVLVENLTSRGHRWLLDTKPYAAFFVHGKNLSGDLSARRDRAILLAECPPLSPVPVARALMWIRKFTRGSYALRRVNPSIFTRESRDQRTRISPRYVTWFWPQSL
jgi:glycosyltransferase